MKTLTIKSGSNNTETLKKIASKKGSSESRLKQSPVKVPHMLPMYVITKRPIVRWLQSKMIR